MTIEQLILNFRDGATRGKASGGRLRIEGNKLINYYTILAIRDDEGFIDLNVKKYSRTTTKIQNWIKDYCKTKIKNEYIGDDAYITGIVGYW